MFNGSAYAFAEDAAGVVWIASGNGIIRFDGTRWEGITGPGAVYLEFTSIARDDEGRMWFGSPTTLAMYDDSEWEVYGRATGLPTGEVTALFVDTLGRVWVGFGWNEEPSVYVGMYDGKTWQFFGRDNSGGALVNSIYGFAEDAAGRVWAAGDGIAVYDDSTWIDADPLPYVWYCDLTIDNNQHLWLAKGTVGELHVLWHGLDYPIVDNGEWLAPNRYRATIDVTAEIPRGTYVVSVADAVGTDGMAIAPHEVQTFTIDYAGAVTDGTAPSRPTITALGDGSLSTIRAEWSSRDAESDIDQCRYAVGTTPGGRDVRDWVYVSGNTTTATIIGLLLQQGRTYYVTVAARNGTGLWSAPGISNPVVAGEVTVIPKEVHLPLMRR